MAQTFNLVRPSGDTSAALVLSGTVQGSATLTTDYVVSGFDTFTATAWSATMPAGSSTKSLTIEAVSDTIFEPTEGVFLVLTSNSGGTIDGLNNSVLYSIIDDDSQQLLRALSTGGSALVGSPALATANAGAASTLLGYQAVQYSAASLTALSTGSAIKQNQLYDGSKVWIEFAYKANGNPSNANTTSFTLNFGGGIILSCTANNLVITGAAGVTSNTVAVGHQIDATVQLRLVGGAYSLFLNGDEAATGYYATNVATTDATVSWGNGANSGYIVAGLKITRGTYDPGNFSEYQP
jgi:hypothetical protein